MASPSVWPSRWEHSVGTRNSFFEARFLARRCLCLHFTRYLAAPSARHKVKMVRYSFLVGLFHPRLHAGLSRRLRSHMSTHTASIPYRRRVLNSSWKNDPPVSERAVSACGRSFRVQLWQVRGLSCAWRPRGVMGVSGRPVGRLAWCLSASLSRSRAALERRKSSPLRGEA